jgi:hypothetical protein
MEWNNGILSKAVIKANYDSPCRLRTGTPVKVFAGGKEIEVTRQGENCIEFEATAGARYEVKR